MNAQIIELIILAAIAAFVLFRLRNVLGTRTGYEKPPESMNGAAPEKPSPAGRSRDFEVIEGGGDRISEIAEYVDPDGDSGQALKRMIKIEPDFSVDGFMQGARAAYEMILMAYEHGDTETLRPLLAEDVYEGFARAIESRKREGLTVEARFVGLREIKIFSVMFDEDTHEAHVEIRFVGETVTVVRNAAHEVVEGDPTEVRRQTDLWTFSRVMGSDDPNWRLTATGG